MIEGQQRDVLCAYAFNRVKSLCVRRAPGFFVDKKRSLLLISQWLLKGFVNLIMIMTSPGIEPGFTP